MNFLVPAFLAALAALAIPIAMHLRHREKGTPVRFPSLMFLEQLSIRTSKRQRITDWPLLLLRALALALLVLAFSRPFVGGSTADAATDAPNTKVILLDRSLSMGHADTWAAAIDSARGVVRDAGPADRLALILFDDEAEVAQTLTTDHAAIDAMLQAARPGSRGTRYVSALRAARSVLLDAPNVPVEVLVVTDLQRGGVAGLAGLELPARMTVRPVSVAPGDQGNVSVSGVDVRRVADAERTRLSVQARVNARSLSEPRTLRARLEIDGRASGEQELTVPTDGERVVSFAGVPLPSGRVRGLITLDNDKLAADDSFHFALAGEDALPIVLLAADDAVGTETLFAERALAIGRAPTVRMERRRPGTLTTAAVQNAGLVFVWDTPITDSERSVLETFVRGGGGAVVFIGRRLATRGAAIPLGVGTVDGSADRFADRGGTLGDVQSEHPLFSAFRETPGALSAARFVRYPRLEPAAGSDVLARFDDGLPAVVERRDGPGRVVTLTTPLDTRTGDLPLQPAFFPLIRRLVLHTSGHAAAPLWQSTSEAWALPKSIREPVVSTPSGDIVRPAASDSVGAAVPLAERGVYSAYATVVSGDPLATVAVNVSAVESDLTPVDARELLVGVAVSDQEDGANAGPAGSIELEKRQSMWRWLLMVAALLLLAETLLANRGWRGKAARLTVAGPERSAP